MPGAPDAAAFHLTLLRTVASTLSLPPVATPAAARATVRDRLRIGHDSPAYACSPLPRTFGFRGFVCPRQEKDHTDGHGLVPAHYRGPWLPRQGPRALELEAAMGHPERAALDRPTGADSSRLPRPGVWHPGLAANGQGWTWVGG